MPKLPVPRVFRRPPSNAMLLTVLGEFLAGVFIRPQSLDYVTLVFVLNLENTSSFSLIRDTQTFLV